MDDNSSDYGTIFPSGQVLTLIASLVDIGAFAVYRFFV